MRLKMAKKSHEKVLDILFLEECKLKLQYHLIPVRMAIIWRGCGEMGTILHFWWEYKLVQPLWKIVWRFLKVTENRPTI